MHVVFQSCWVTTLTLVSHHMQATVGVLMGIGAFPWVVKPLYGFLSDSVPLFGYKRRSYLVACGLLGEAHISVTVLANLGPLGDGYVRPQECP